MTGDTPLRKIAVSARRQSQVVLIVITPMQIRIYPNYALATNYAWPNGPVVRYLLRVSSRPCCG